LFLLTHASPFYFAYAGPAEMAVNRDLPNELQFFQADNWQFQFSNGQLQLCNGLCCSLDVVPRNPLLNWSCPLLNWNCPLSAWKNCIQINPATEPATIKAIIAVVQNIRIDSGSTPGPT
jgi:hypothetical protein